MKLFELIKAGKHTAIIEYLTNSETLMGGEDVALVQRGNHEEIMMAIARTLLWPDALDALVERGNLNEIRFMLVTSPNAFISYHDVEKLIPFGRGIANAYADMLLAHTDIQKFDEVMTPLQVALIRMGDHRALRRYICKCKLTPKAYKVFQREGIPEDFLVYSLVHSVEG